MPSAGTSRKYKGVVQSGLGCQSDEAARVAVKHHWNVSNTFTKFLDLAIRFIKLFVYNNPDELIH